jgi:hypothetical protein
VNKAPNQNTVEYMTSKITIEFPLLCSKVSDTTTNAGLEKKATEESAISLMP